jgi:hypothetical protein
MNDQLYALLIRSFDASLDRKEQIQLQQALSEPEIRVEHDRIVTLRKMIGQTAASTFKPFFVQRLLQRLVSAHEEFRRWLLWGFRRVALTGVVIALLLACYNISKQHSVSLAAAFAQPEYTLEQVLRFEVLSQ